MASAPRELASGEVCQSPVAAIVPRNIGDGVFSNGLFVLQAQGESVLDFYSTIARPPRFVARVVLSLPALIEMFDGLTASVLQYESQFGSLSARVKEPRLGDAENGPIWSAADAMTEPATASSSANAAALGPLPANTAELYERFRLPDELLGGVFANRVLIAYTASEFSLDFIAMLYPRASVSSRVLMSAARMPVVLSTLQAALKHFGEQPKAN